MIEVIISITYIREKRGEGVQNSWVYDSITRGRREKFE